MQPPLRQFGAHLIQARLSMAAMLHSSRIELVPTTPTIECGERAVCVAIFGPERLEPAWRVTIGAEPASVCARCEQVLAACSGPRVPDSGRRW